MSRILPAACQRVVDAAIRLELPIEIMLLDQSSRTAEEAAKACDTTPAQIVKSLVFCRDDNLEPLLVLVSGKNRVHEKRTGKRIGCKLSRPDAAYVRKATGFAIGGIPPMGHATPIATFIDEDLLLFDKVYAAAGTPNSVFRVDPKALAQALAATVISVV